MPLEFALRPRIRLREDVPSPRRSRWRFPKLALPVAAYWLTAGGITYALIHWHDQPDAPVAAQLVAAAPEPKPDHEWWQPVPARPAAAAGEAEPARTPVVAEPAATIAEPPAPPIDDSPIATEPALDRASSLAENAAPTARHEARKKSESNELWAGAARTDSAPDPRAFERRAIPAPDLFALPPLEPAPPREASPLLGATPPDAPAAVASSLRSCESAAAAANQEIDVAHRDDTPDLSRATIASVLDNGVWIARCDIPMSTSIELCVAIQAGKVIGVSVSSHPASAAIDACVKRRAAGLRFPFSSRVDIAKTHF